MSTFFNPTAPYINRKQGSNAESIQHDNRSLILHMIKSAGVISRTELARKSKLNSATISIIVNELLEARVVEEKGLVNGTNGRRLAGIGLANDTMYSIVIRLNTSYIAVGAFDANSQFLSAKKYFMDTISNLKNTYEHVIAEIDSLRAKYKDRRLLGIGVAVEGPFYQEGSDYVIPDPLHPESVLNIAQLLRTHYSLPIHVSSARNFHSYYYWCSEKPDDRDHSSIININISYTVECSILINGQIINGHNGMAGSIGYWPLAGTPESPITLNDAISSHSILDQVLELLPNYPNSTLSVLKDLNIRDVIRAYQNGDPLALYVYNRAAESLARAIANILLLINPKLITIADEIPISEQFLQTIRAQVKCKVPHMVFDSTSIEYGIHMQERTIRNDTIMRGCSLYVSDYAVSTLSIL